MCYVEVHSTGEVPRDLYIVCASKLAIGEPEDAGFIQIVLCRGRNHSAHFIKSEDPNQADKDRQAGRQLDKEACQSAKGNVWAHSSSFLSCLNCVLWRKLRSAFPFFRITGPRACQSQEFPVPDSDSRSLVVHLACPSFADQSGNLCWQSRGGFDSRIERFLFLSGRDRAGSISAGTHSLPTRHTCNHVNSVCPVPQQSGHQSAEDGQPSCHANPTRTANPRCTKLLLRFRQLASQTTRCQSRCIYNRMRNNSRYQVHQCTLSQNRKSQSIKAR